MNPARSAIISATYVVLDEEQPWNWMICFPDESPLVPNRWKDISADLMAQLPHNIMIRRSESMKEKLFDKIKELDFYRTHTKYQEFSKVAREVAKTYSADEIYSWLDEYFEKHPTDFRFKNTITLELEFWVEYWEEMKNGTNKQER